MTWKYIAKWDINYYHLEFTNITNFVILKHLNNTSNKMNIQYIIPIKHNTRL